MAVQAGTEILDGSVRETARTYAFDDYLSALLAPRAVRDDLVALAAFWGETGRVLLTVREAVLGEIRLQWWRDAVRPGAAPTGSPLADVMQGVIIRRALAGDLIDQLIDSRMTELTDVPFADEASFSRHLDRSDGAFLRLSAHVQAGDAAAKAERFVAAAAQSLGRVRIAREMGALIALGRVPLWPAALGDASGAFDSGAGAARARDAIATLARGARTARAEAIHRAPRMQGSIAATLPLALVEPYLRALEDQRYDPLRTKADITPLGRIARLAWARLSGRP